MHKFLAGFFVQTVRFATLGAICAISAMFTFAGHATGRSLKNIWRVFSHFAVRRRILISVATWSRELLKHTLFHKFIHVRCKYKGNDKLPLVKFA
jgi:hypothetical protein